MPKWVIGVIAAVGISGLLGAGAWVQRQERDIVDFKDHNRETCIRWCIDDCVESCRRNGIRPNDCNCNHCYAKCGGRGL